MALEGSFHGRPHFETRKAVTLSNFEKNILHTANRSKDGRGFCMAWQRQWRSARARARRRSEPLSALSVLREFPEATTLHGVRYLARPGAPLLDRLCWAAALATCGVCAVVFVGSAWHSYRLSPTITSVESTMFPLERLNFPAITVCASSNIKTRLAEERLLQFVGGADNASAALLLQVRAVLQALAKFRFPYYYDMAPHVENARPLLPPLDALNVTAFALSVMPTCEEIFYKCFWRGQPLNCCEVFQLQRLEGGFCYSFNSLTSEETSHCVSRQAARALEEAGRPTGAGPECLMRRNAASGMSSGLELLLRHPPSTLPLQRRIGRGYQVLLHDASNYPQLGRGLFVATRRGAKTSGTLRVVPSLTETAPSVRALAAAARHCYFPDERRLRINPEYTLDSCLLECRLRRILRNCACLPFFFSTFDVDAPICNMTELQCIIKHSGELRPGGAGEAEAVVEAAAAAGTGAEQEGGKRGRGRGRGESLDCSWCLPACYDRSYMVATTTVTADAAGDDYGAYADVYYEEMGAIKYRRDLVVNTIDLIVSLGGIASLFLGVSLLSGVELLYYVWMLLRAALTTLHSRMVVRAKGKGGGEAKRRPDGCGPCSPSHSPLFILRPRQVFASPNKTPW